MMAKTVYNVISEYIPVNPSKKVTIKRFFGIESSNTKNSNNSDE